MENPGSRGPNHRSSADSISWQEMEETFDWRARIDLDTRIPE